MKLYKYKSLDNLWHILDIVLGNKVYCAHWSELNDPLEGRYEIFRDHNHSFRHFEAKIDTIKNDKDRYRIASFSSDPTNFLLWSHYADGHKGVAIEVDVSLDESPLHEVVYSPFSSVFTDEAQLDESLYHLFIGKTEEWRYEKEWRIITDQRYYHLINPVKRILLGALIPDDRIEYITALLPKSITLDKTTIDKKQGCIEVSVTNN